MDAFSYLSVLLSIIIGLAMTQVLQGYRALLLSRARVTAYLPSLIWSVLVLVMATQSWWASFGLSARSHWTFASFTVILLQTVLLYMVAGLVFPEIPPGEPVDLRVHYHRETRPFFGLFVAMLLVSLGKEWALVGHAPERENLAFHGGFLALALLGLTVRHPRVHQGIALVTPLLLGAYIALLFSRL